MFNFWPNLIKHQIRTNTFCQNMTLITAQKCFKLQACELPLNTTRMEVASGKERQLDNNENKPNFKTCGTIILRFEEIVFVKDN